MIDDAPATRRFAAKPRVSVVLLCMLGAVPACGSSGAGGDDDNPWREAFDAEKRGWFLNAWGSSENDVYALGGESSRGVIMHFDGRNWAPLDLGIDVPLLTWMYGFGPDDITAVGFAGTAMHWDGTNFTLQETPTTEDLWGVWGSAANDLWAVGGSGRPDAVATLLHYDGIAWAEVALPPITPSSVFALFKVFGTSAENVYVVGQRGVVLHWNGQNWQEEDAGTSEDLVSIWGTGPDHLVAVGGRANGIVSTWNGSAWKTVSLAPLPGLNGIWMNKPGVAHAVGALGTLIEIDLGGPDGSSGPGVPGALTYQDSSIASALDFHGVFSVAGQTLFAVGGNLTVPSDTFEGIAYARTLGSP